MPKVNSLGQTPVKKLIQEEHNTKPNRVTVTKEEEIKTARRAVLKIKIERLVGARFLCRFFGNTLAT